MNKVFKVSKANMRDTFIFPKFSSQVFNFLAQQYKHTYFVGGAVRDALLHQKISDVDIATSATPEMIVKVLVENRIKFDDTHKKFGVIIAKSRGAKVEITTFRRELYGASRYPTVAFLNSPKGDSNRRDFTINALYYDPLKGGILDYHNGLRDLQKGVIRFIGNAEKRIQEDPLRIVRAYRFKLQYNLQFTKQTEVVLKTNMHLIKNISRAKILNEINKLSSTKLKKQLQKVIHNVY